VKPRYAATLALVGWYLLVPPSRPNYEVDQSAPLSRWAQDASFDTASECEHNRQEMIESLASHKVKNMSVEMQNGNARIYALSRCIATDDPRLNSN
jgi:hypothetical protein